MSNQDWFGIFAMMGFIGFILYGVGHQIHIVGNVLCHNLRDISNQLSHIDTAIRLQTNLLNILNEDEEDEEDNYSSMGTL